MDHDWTGIDLRSMAKLSPELVEPSLKSLRKWLDATYPDGGRTIRPTDRTTSIVTADQLGEASLGRRDACFSDLREWLGHLRSRAAEGPAAPEGMLDRLVSSTARMLGYTEHTVEDGFRWMDDGRTDVATTMSVGVGPFFGIEAKATWRRIHEPEEASDGTAPRI